LLEREQVLVKAIEVLVALDEKLDDHFVDHGGSTHTVAACYPTEADEIG